MIDAAPRRLYGGGTSIAGALDYGVGVFKDSGFRSMRRVIDVSGDGANTSGRPVSRARDDAVAAGVVVNGLPILSLEFDLDEHYKNEVIGGPGSFLVPAKSSRCSRTPCAASSSRRSRARVSERRAEICGWSACADA